MWPLAVSPLQEAHMIAIECRMNGWRKWRVQRLFEGEDTKSQRESRKFPMTSEAIASANRGRAGASLLASGVTLLSKEPA